MQKENESPGGAGPVDQIKSIQTEQPQYQARPLVYAQRSQPTYNKRPENPQHILHGSRIQHWLYLLKVPPFSVHKKNVAAAQSYIQQQTDPNKALASATIAPKQGLRHYITHPKTLLVFSSIALLLVASFLALNYKPNVPVVAKQKQLAGITIENLPKTEALKKLNETAATQQMAITIDGTVYTFTAKDLGITRDFSQVVDANYTGAESKLEQFTKKSSQSAKIATFINQKKLITAIESKLGQYKAPVNATIAVSGDTVVVQPGKPGLSIDFTKIIALVESAEISTPLQIHAELTKTEPAITTAVAAAAKAEADAYISKTYGVTTPANGAKYASRAQKAAWLRFTTNDKSIAVTIDTSAAKATLTGLANSYTQKAKDKTVLSLNGAAPTVIDPGQNSVSVDQASVNAGLAQLEPALTSHQDYTFALTLAVQPAAERNLGSLNGGKFILVDVPRFKAYAIENSSTVRTMLVSTGTAAMPTPAGHFKILSKMPSKTMTGCNTAAGCWSVPNVPNVQFFTREGHAFHGTYWHNQFGIRNMSHGCVNLTQTDAAWLYGWTQVGTDVVVIR